MDHSADALRTSVRTHLLAQSTIASSVSGIYETAPADAVYPYVTLGDDRMRDWSTQTFTGVDHQLLINCWSNSHNFAELYALHRLIRQHLVKTAFSLEQHHLVAFFMEEERFLVDRRRKSRLGVLRYRALTHPADIAA